MQSEMDVPDFKTGDCVYEKSTGEIGVVASVLRANSRCLDIVQFRRQDQHLHECYASKLTKVVVEYGKKLQVGDRVKIVNWHDMHVGKLPYIGRIATVRFVSGNSFHLSFAEEPSSFVWSREELEGPLVIPNTIVSEAPVTPVQTVSARRYTKVEMVRLSELLKRYPVENFDVINADKYNMEFLIGHLPGENEAQKTAMQLANLISDKAALNLSVEALTKTIVSLEETRDAILKEAHEAHGKLRELTGLSEYQRGEIARLTKELCVQVAPEMEKNEAVLVDLVDTEREAGIEEPAGNNTLLNSSWSELFARVKVLENKKTGGEQDVDRR